MIYVTFFFLALPILGNAQAVKLTDKQINESGVNQLNFIDSLSEATDLARLDIANKLPFLILKGGVSPVVYTTDAKFQGDFNIYFYDLGCTGTLDKYAIEYNRVIFEYLTSVFGKKWIRIVRKDVIGLTAYKHNKL